MKITEIYNTQKKLINTIYEETKLLDTINPRMEEDEFNRYMEDIEEISKPLIEMRDKSKLKFYAGSILTNLNLNVWKQALYIRKVNKSKQKYY